MIDVTKCIGCRKGIGSFLLKDEIYSHFDLFATREASSIYKCENSKEIKLLLIQEKNNVFTTNEELTIYFREQDFWFQDIVDLAYDIIGNKTDVNNFFKTEINEKQYWQLSNSEIENILINLANDKQIEIIGENYPDLEKFKNK